MLKSGARTRSCNNATSNESTAESLVGDNAMYSSAIVDADDALVRRSGVVGGDERAHGRGDGGEASSGVLAPGRWVMRRLYGRMRAGRRKDGHHEVVRLRPGGRGFQHAASPGPRTRSARWWPAKTYNLGTSSKASRDFRVFDIPHGVYAVVEVEARDLPMASATRASIVRLARKRERWAPPGTS